MVEKITKGMKAFFELLGLKEEPFGKFYMDQEPRKGFSLQSENLPNADMG